MELRIYLIHSYGVNVHSAVGGERVEITAQSKIRQRCI